MVETIASDECDGCDSKIYSLLNLETQLVQVERYTTVIGRELGKKETLDQEPSYAERYPLAGLWECERGNRLK